MRAHVYWWRRALRALRKRRESFQVWWYTRHIRRKTVRLRIVKSVVLFAALSQASCAGAVSVPFVLAQVFKSSMEVAGEARKLERLTRHLEGQWAEGPSGEEGAP